MRRVLILPVAKIESALELLVFKRVSTSQLGAGESDLISCEVKPGETFGYAAVNRFCEAVIGFSDVLLFNIGDRFLEDNQGNSYHLRTYIAVIDRIPEFPLQHATDDHSATIYRRFEDFQSDDVRPSGTVFQWLEELFPESNEYITWDHVKFALPLLPKVLARNRISSLVNSSVSPTI